MNNWECKAIIAWRTFMQFLIGVDILLTMNHSELTVAHWFRRIFSFLLFFGRQCLYTCCTFGWSSGCLLQRTLTRFLGILLSPLFMCYSTHLNALLECFPALWSVPVQAYAFSANSAPPSYPFTVRAYVSPWICASNFDPKTLILFLFLCYAGCG